MGVHNTNKSRGGDKEIYPFTGADDYVDKDLPFIEEFYDLRKSFVKIFSAMGIPP